MLDEAGGGGAKLDVVLSGQIGGPGLLERENAAVLNAAILETARRAIAGFKRAMRRLRLEECPLYLSQNDGTLIDADAAAEFPIKTFASGPTNSMTGAAFLAGLDRSRADLEFIGTGAGVLGTGGGGPTHHEFLKCVDTLRRSEPGKMRIVDPSSLRDSDLVALGAWYGAPSVSGERISAGGEMSLGIDTLVKIMGIESVAGILSLEIGGQNGLSAFPTGVKYDIPVVDADGMGRAYPTMYHTTMYVYDQPVCPVVLTDGRDNCSVIMNADSPSRVESLLRTTAVELGLSCAVVARPLPGDVIKKLAIPNTISQAWYLGRAVHMARKHKTSYIDAIFDVNPGKLLFTGKIVDVQRDVSRGYTMGSVLLAPLSSDEREGAGTASSRVAAPLSPQDPAKQHMRVPFQNEYLYVAFTDGERDEEEVACAVPDLISILGQDGEAVGSQELRYGLRVSVIGVPAHPLWKETARAMGVGGPAGFGLGVPFVGVGGEYARPRSVIGEYGRA